MNNSKVIKIFRKIDNEFDQTFEAVKEQAKNLRVLLAQIKKSYKLDKETLKRFFDKCKIELKKLIKNILARTKRVLGFNVTLKEDSTAVELDKNIDLEKKSDLEKLMKELFFPFRWVSRIIESSAKPLSAIIPKGVAYAIVAVTIPFLVSYSIYAIGKKFIEKKITKLYHDAIVKFLRKDSKASKLLKKIFTMLGKTRKVAEAPKPRKKSRKLKTEVELDSLVDDFDIDSNEFLSEPIISLENVNINNLFKKAGEFIKKEWDRSPTKKFVKNVSEKTGATIIKKTEQAKKHIGKGIVKTAKGSAKIITKAGAKGGMLTIDSILAYLKANGFFVELELFLRESADFVVMFIIKIIMYMIVNIASIIPYIAASQLAHANKSTKMFQSAYLALNQTAHKLSEKAHSQYYKFFKSKTNPFVMSYSVIKDALQQILSANMIVNYATNGKYNRVYFYLTFLLGLFKILTLGPDIIVFTGVNIKTMKNAAENIIKSF